MLFMWCIQQYYYCTCALPHNTQACKRKTKHKKHHHRRRSRTCVDACSPVNNAAVMSPSLRVLPDYTPLADLRAPLVKEFSIGIYVHPHVLLSCSFSRSGRTHHHTLNFDWTCFRFLLLRFPHCPGLRRGSGECEAMLRLSCEERSSCEL